MDIKQQETQVIEFLYIGFGTILGAILTLGITIITDSIRNRQRVKTFRKTVLVELKEVQIRLALTYHILAEKRGELTAKNFRWVCKLVENYKGIAVSSQIRDGLNLLKGKSDEELEKAFPALKKPETKREAIKKYSLNALNSGLIDVGRLKLKDSHVIFEILNLLDLFNQTVDDYRQFFAITFDPKLPENYAIASKNLTACEQTLMAAAKSLAEKIDLLSP